MAQADLQKLANTLERKLFASSAEYRSEVSDKQAHSFRIDSSDIIHQVKQEMKKRSGGFGDVLPKSIEEVIEREVPLFCASMYRIFDPSRPIFKRAGSKVAPQRRIGSERSFVFILVSKATDGPSVFKAFRTRKQRLQKNLVKALQDEIDNLNSGKKGADKVRGMYRTDTRTRRKDGTRYQVKVVDDFLDIGHEEASAVFLQRGRAAEQALLQFSSASEEANKFVREILQNYQVVLRKMSTKKGGLQLVRASLEATSINRSKGLGVEFENSQKLEKELARLLGDKVNWPEQEGSDSPVKMVEKKMLNELLLITQGNKKAKANFRRQKIKQSNNTPVKSKARKPKITQADAVKDTQAIRFSTKGVRTGGASPDLSIGALLGLLNQNLTKTVQKNMGAPALNNVSGRFAGSVRAVDVTKTPKGFPSVGYTYQRSPYGVYESSSGSRFSSAERDPRPLIDASIREIAAQYLQTRIFTRRL